MSDIQVNIDSAREQSNNFANAANAISKQTLSEGETTIKDYVRAKNSFENVANALVQFAEGIRQNSEGIVKIAETMIIHEKDMAGYGGQP